MKYIHSVTFSLKNNNIDKTKDAQAHLTLLHVLEYDKVMLHLPT